MLEVSQSQECCLSGSVGFAANSIGPPINRVRYSMVAIVRRGRSSPILSEAIRLADRANVRLVIDK